jgi:nucleoid DNA-binding protein
MNKSQLLQKLSDDSQIPKPQVKLLLETIAKVAQEQLVSEGAFALPDVATLKLVTKAATPERDGINPFTKQKVRFPAKPESKKVKASPASSLNKAFA